MASRYGISIKNIQTTIETNEEAEFIVLPEDEQPTIATVSDPEVLKGQPFFAKAKKGFKVLIYANAKKSILYDPFENKVVETASMNIGGN